MQRTLGTLVLLLVPLATQSQVFTYTFGGGAIPDDSPLAGLALSGSVPADTSSVTGLRVALSLSGSGGGNAFNGDFYAWLRHDPGDGGPIGFAVLLNRLGARAGEPFGYGDNGLSVTFDDSPGAGLDIHNYRLSLSGSHTTAIPAPGLLTGLWASDGREADPGSVLDSSDRTARLNSFIGLNPAGTWQLYVEDLSSGAAAQVDFWSLEITGPGIPVPEPGEMMLVTGLGLGTLAAWRWKRRSV